MKTCRNLLLALFGGISIACSSHDGESSASSGDTIGSSADASAPGTSSSEGGSSSTGSTDTEPPANAAPVNASEGGVMRPEGAVDAGGAAPADGGLSAGAVDAGACARCTGSGDWRAGDYPPKLTEQEYLPIKGVKGQGDSVRGYKVHVPPSYDPNKGTGDTTGIGTAIVGANSKNFVNTDAAWEFLKRFAR